MCSNRFCNGFVVVVAMCIIIGWLRRYFTYSILKKLFVSSLRILYSLRLLLCRMRPFSYPLFLLLFVCIHGLNMFFLSRRAFSPAAPYEIVIENNKGFIFSFWIPRICRPFAFHVKMLRKQFMFSDDYYVLRTFRFVRDIVFRMCRLCCKIFITIRKLI